MNQIYYILLFLLLLVSCQGEQVSVSSEDNLWHDSTALHIAVMPVMDCLPIYYAEQAGMFKAENLDVSLIEYLSQMDCDTALQNKYVEVAYTDIIRVLQMKENISVITSMYGKLSLLTAHSKRIRKLKHLNERMVALDRLSTADYWSDRLMDEAGMEMNAIYRPQINDIRLRTSMFTEQLLDAALLPEPYATQAEMQGNRRIKTQLDGDTLPLFNCLAIDRRLLSDSLRHKQITLFLTIYDKAIKKMNSKECKQDVIHSILKSQYEIPESILDTLKIPHFMPSRAPMETEVNEAVRWLQSRERTPLKQRRDSLYYKSM